MTAPETDKPAWTEGTWVVSEVDPLDGTIMVLGGEELGFGLVASFTTRQDAFLGAAAPDLYEALSELAALVRGECPRLLSEDSGGSAPLDAAIRAALSRARGEEQ